MDATMTQQFPSTWFSHSLFVVVSSILVLYIIIRAIYQLYFSPLSVLPGPWYAAINDFWLISHAARLDKCTAVQDLFDSYGPIVRVGPNKIIFRDYNTMKNIYSVQKFDKSQWYKGFVANDNDHAMTILDHSSHVIRRKGYAPHYTPTNLAHFQPEMNDHTLELLNVLDSFAGKVSLECLTLFGHFMGDVIATSMHGYGLGALRKWTEGVEEPLSTAISDFPKRGVFRSAVPKWVWSLLCRIPVNRWRLLCDSDKILTEFVSARVDELRSQLHSGKVSDMKKPMIARLLEYTIGPSNEPMPEKDIISESMGHLIAGTDTTSISLSYFFWELSRRADIMKKLQAELDEAIPDPRVIPDFAALQKLPYLNAFIKEALRIYTAAPSLLERVVPANSKNGAMNESYDLMGYAVPPGTIVATQAWSMHRDSTVFPSPNTFLPDRWLETTTNAEQLNRMQQHMIPFGTGSRICGGQNLAIGMLRTVVAAVARNFDVRANTAETNERTMEIRDSFAIFPVSLECKLRFLPRA